MVVAHPDDEILGFGGTGAFLVNNHEYVQPLILCGEVLERKNRPANDDLLLNMNDANKFLGFEKPIFGKFPNLAMNTVKHISLVKFIENQIETFQPNRIFTHHPSDLNDDHRQVSNACMAAFRLFQRNRNIGRISSLFFMEILSSTEWSFSNSQNKFDPNMYIDIGSYINKKIEALAIYKNVMRESPHPRSSEAIRALSIYRGCQSGYMHAESFQMVYSTSL